MSDVIKTSLLFALVLLFMLPPGYCSDLGAYPNVFPGFTAPDAAPAGPVAQTAAPEVKRVTAGSGSALDSAVKRSPEPSKASGGWSSSAEPVYEFHSREGGYRLHEDSQHHIITVGGDPHHGIYRNPGEDYAPQGFKPSYKCSGIDDRDCTDTWVDRRQWYENRGNPSR